MRVLGHHFPVHIVLLAAAEFAAGAVAFSVSAVVVLSGGTFGDGVLSPSLILAAFGFSAAVFIGVTAMGLYQAKQRLRIEGVLVRIVIGLGLAVVVVSVVDFLFALGMEGPLWAGSFALSLVLLAATRTAMWKWFDQGAFRRKVLVYGAGARAASLLKLRRRSDRRGFDIAAFVPGDGDSQVLDDPRVRRPTVPLLQFAKEEGIDEIVVAMDDRRRGFPISELLECKLAGIAVVDLLAFLERETGKVKVDLVNPSWLIFSEGFEASARARLGSRLLDIAVSSVLLVLAAPVMCIVALVILFDDGPPVLYGQRRVGFLGRPFTILKFRSMIKDAEADGTPRWAGTCDSRITRVGAVLRKLRLDELPQLINVLRGDMSLVGPRPERSEFVEQLSQTIPYYQERHVVKPGITGWAQLCYPYGSSEHDALEKLQYDFYYIKHKSLIFDLMVLLQTAEVVLWGKGAR